MKLIHIILVLTISFSKVFANDRAYNMILVERTFGKAAHCYVLLGLEQGKHWNLLGGKKESTDKNRGVTAARELFEESAMLIDKRDDVVYWSSLLSYEFGMHKVFIHDNLDIKINQLNDAAKKLQADLNVPYCFKEMHRYQLIKLIDLITLAYNQIIDGQVGLYHHSQEQTPMVIDGWLLYTLKNANIDALIPYIY